MQNVPGAGQASRTRSPKIRLHRVSLVLPDADEIASGQVSPMWSIPGTWPQAVLGQKEPAFPGCRLDFNPRERVLLRQSRSSFSPGCLVLLGQLSWSAGAGRWGQATARSGEIPRRILPDEVGLQGERVLVIVISAVPSGLSSHRRSGSSPKSLYGGSATSHETPGRLLEPFLETQVLQRSVQSGPSPRACGSHRAAVQSRVRGPAGQEGSMRIALQEGSRQNPAGAHFVEGRQGQLPLRSRGGSFCEGVSAFCVVANARGHLGGGGGQLIALLPTDRSRPGFRAGAKAGRTAAVKTLLLCLRLRVLKSQ